MKYQSKKNSIELYRTHSHRGTNAKTYAEAIRINGETTGKREQKLNLKTMEKVFLSFKTKVSNEEVIKQMEKAYLTDILKRRDRKGERLKRFLTKWKN